MEFPSLNTADGLKYLDSHLTSRSYISDCEPTQNDDTVFRALGHEPSEEFCNVLRWYRHIQSFGSHRKDLPKSSITLTIPSNSAESKGSGEEVEMKRFVNPSFLLHPLHNNVLFYLLFYKSTMLCTGQMTARLQFWYRVSQQCNVVPAKIAGTTLLANTVCVFHLCLFCSLAEFL